MYAPSVGSQPDAPGFGTAHSGHAQSNRPWYCILRTKLSPRPIALSRIEDGERVAARKSCGVF